MWEKHRQIFVAVAEEAPGTRERVMDTKKGKTAWKSEAAGLTSEESCSFAFDLDKELDSKGVKVNAEFSKASKYDVNGMCGEANIKINEKKDCVSCYRHFEMEDSGTSAGATNFVHRAAAPEKISQAVRHAVGVPSAADALEMADLVHTSDILLGLFPVHGDASSLTEDQAMQLIKKLRGGILDGKSKLRTLQVSVRGQQEPVSIRVGGTAADTRRNLLELVMSQGEPEIISVTCAHISLSGCADLLQSLHARLEEVVKDSYKICLACFAIGDFDGALDVALIMADAQHVMHVT